MKRSPDLRFAVGNDSPAPVGLLRQSAAVDLDLLKLEAEGYLVPSLDQSSLAEEFRHLKRMLLANVAAGVDGDPLRRPLIMVTSALPGEGKTYCSINLAMSLAMEVDTSVLLVDADVLRPAVADRVGVRGGRGLLDVLSEGRADIDDVIMKTNVPKLSLLTAGTPDRRASELLTSRAMERLLAELVARDPNRVVIFDSPPLLMATGASSLASHMGQVVILVEASRTPKRAVKQAFATLERCRFVLSVLNKCDRGQNVQHYGHYYGPPPVIKGDERARKGMAASAVADLRERGR